MKSYIRYRTRRFIAAAFFSFLICLGEVLVPAPAVCQNSVADEIVSLDVTSKPLGEVLEDISADIGCEFSIDGKWEDYPITASFINKPLHKALKLIFRDLNNAVVYGSERTVKILIFDKSTASGEKSVPSASPLQEATAPQPEEQGFEDGSPPENEQYSNEDAEFQPGREEADDETEETEEEGTDREDEDRVENPEPGPQSARDGEDGEQIENSEPAEGDQKTNEN
jgi:hypothetical protein